MSQPTGLIVPTTPRDLLVDADGTPTDDDARQRFELALDDAGVGRVKMTAISRLTPAAKHAVQEQVKTVLSTLLGKPFGELLVGGWQTSSRLMDAARHSLLYPGVEEGADLREHTVTVRHGPKIKVVIDEAVVATIRVGLVTRFTLTKLFARIRDGAIVAFDGGTVVIETSLTVQDIEVATGRAELDAHAVVPLGRGVVLVSPGPTVTLPRDGRVHEGLPN